MIDGFEGLLFISTEDLEKIMMLRNYLRSSPDKVEIDIADKLDVIVKSVLETNGIRK